MRPSSAFIKSLETNKPDALLLFNFWNSFSAKLRPILDAWKGPIILYHPVGANHQAPPEYFRTAPRVQYIHSIENWDALERGLRAVHAMTRMAQSRLLRVASQFKQQADTTEPFFGLAIRGVPAEQFNALFDETKLSPEMERLAKSVRRHARHVTDLSDTAFHDAVRSHAAVQKIMERHEADAITIECLHAEAPQAVPELRPEQRQPACPAAARTTSTPRSRSCSAPTASAAAASSTTPSSTPSRTSTSARTAPAPRGCTARARRKPLTACARSSIKCPSRSPWTCNGRRARPVTLCKYHSGKKQLDAWRGQVVSSPTCPPTGGCATRVLVKIPDVKDVCTVYPGPHPVLYCGDFAAPPQDARPALRAGAADQLRLSGN